MVAGYKLKYFAVRGTAEPIRYLFKYGNIEFEDERISREEWPELKENTPFGVLPILEINGKVIGESVSICRYLGKLVGLAGKDDWENFEIDSVVDTFQDIRAKYSKSYGITDPDEKQAFAKNFAEEVLPFYLERLDKIAQENNSYLALERLTWADLYFASIAEGFDAALGYNAFQQYSNLEKLRRKVYKLPAIKKWIEERPQTLY